MQTLIRHVAVAASLRTQDYDNNSMARAEIGNSALIAPVECPRLARREFRVWSISKFAGASVIRHPNLRARLDHTLLGQAPNAARLSSGDQARRRWWLCHDRLRVFATSVESLRVLSQRSLLFAQRSEGRPVTRRRLDDDGAGHARADQHSFGDVVDMDAHRNPLGKPDPLEGRIGIG